MEWIPITAFKRRDGDGLFTNTIEGVWTTLRNFLRPFRGVHKKFLAGYVV